MVLQRVSSFLTGLMVSMMMAAPAMAALTGPSAPTAAGGFSDLTTSINTIFNFVIVLGAVVFVILFLVGGIQYLTAAGNEEATGKAKRLLVDAIVGLVLVLAAWAIGNFILDRLGVSVSTSGGAAGGGGGGR